VNFNSLPSVTAGGPTVIGVSSVWLLSVCLLHTEIYVHGV